MMPGGASVQLIGIEKRFGDAVAVEDVNIEISPGEFFSLLGPSGCGKTTTLRIIAGFESASSGTVRIDGEDMTSVPVNRRPANMVFQNYALFPHLSVFENVAFGLRVGKTPREEIVGRVGEALQMMQLEGLDRRKPRQLSGGQQQRVAVARALVDRPSVLLLDEPLGALDLKLRKDMQLELKRLQREVGITFVYVTHDQEEALAMSDRVAVMSGGRVLQVDSPVDLYEQPRSRFVADFIGAGNFLTGRVSRVGGGEALVVLKGGTEVRAGLAGRNLGVGDQVTLMLRPERIAIEGDLPNQASGTLEDLVFVGSDTLLVVRLAGGQDVLVRHQNRVPGDALRNRKAGDQIRLGWRPEASVIVD